MKMSIALTFKMIELCSHGTRYEVKKSMENLIIDSQCKLDKSTKPKQVSYRNFEEYDELAETSNFKRTTPGSLNNFLLMR